MAYTKQTWTDDVSAVTGARMTHIEQGIYDNSLATDKINPSGTATTTAEIEEGQITDVIGFKSLKLKGQTSQYTTTGINLLSVNTGSDGVTLVDKDHYITNVNQSYVVKTGITLQANTTYYYKFKLLTRPSTATTFSTYFDGTQDTSAGFSNIQREADFNLNQVYTRTITPTADTVMTVTQYGNTNSEKFKFQLWLTTDNTKNTFEPYTGKKASPNPDFPQDVNNVSGDNVIRISNKNLYDKDDSNLIMNNVYINATGFVLTSSNNMKTICMPCRANTTYTVSKTLSSRFIIGTATSNTIGTSMTAGRTNPSGTQVSVTSGANDKYLFVFYYHGTADTKTEQEIRNSIQVEIGSSATSYIAHQGNNFEINLGNNLMKTKPLVEATVNGITFTPVYDGNKLQYVNVNGTSTAVASYILQNANVDTASTFVDELSAGTYTLSDFSGSNTPNIAIFLRYTTNGSTFTTQNSVDSKTLTVSSKFKYASYIRIASGATVNNMKFYPQIEKGANATTSYAPYFPPIYQGKIGTYCNDIRKYNGKWYWHREIGNVILDGTTFAVEAKSGSTANNAFITKVIADIIAPSGNDTAIQLLSDKFQSKSANYIYLNDIYAISVRTDKKLQFGMTLNDERNTVALVNTWLAGNNVIVYYPLATPTDEEITYAPLLRQLDELYNSGLYDVTNISQDNSSEAFILDLEACKNNINGIVEYIRR